MAAGALGRLGMGAATLGALGLLIPAMALVIPAHDAAARDSAPTIDAPVEATVAPAGNALVEADPGDPGRLPDASASAPDRAEATGGAAAVDGYVIRKIMQIDGPLQHGDWYWDEAGAPQGPLLITIDLKAQTLSVFRGGHEIGVAVILYGADHKPTPLGRFTITEKDADHVSNLYDAPMPWMLRLTNDGISIHGSKIDYGYATHGCVGVPNEFAKLLYGQAKLGDRVVITSGQTMGIGDQVAGI